MLAISGQHAAPVNKISPGREKSPSPARLSEPYHHRELNQTWIAVGIRNLPEAVTRRGAGSGRGSVEALTRNAELRVVEEVEEFRSELDTHFFGNRGSLEDGEVKVFGPVTAKGCVHTRLAAESPVWGG